MTSETTQSPVDDNRRFIRLPYAAAARYRYGTHENGHAEVRDVGRGGIAVQLGRYLRPGTLVMVAIRDDGALGLDVEFKACVAWCDPLAGTSDFAAGLRLIHDQLAAVTEISRILHRALLATDRMRNWPSRDREHDTDYRQADSTQPLLPIASGT